MSDDRTLLDRYLADVRRLPRVAYPDLLKLHELMQAGDKDATRQLWEQCLRLVTAAAFKAYQRHGQPFTIDVLQEGNAAALEALRTWKPALGKLSTHVMMVASRRMSDARNKERARGTGGKNAPPPWMLELDASAGIIDDFSESDEPGTELPDESPMHDVVSAESNTQPDEDPAEQWAAVKAAIPDRSMKFILEAYYGLDGGEPLSLDQIAAVLRMSRSTVHRKLQSGISLARDILQKRANTVVRSIAH